MPYSLNLTMSCSYNVLVNISFLFSCFCSISWIFFRRLSWLQLSSSVVFKSVERDLSCVHSWVGVKGGGQEPWTQKNFSFPMPIHFHIWRFHFHLKIYIPSSLCLRVLRSFHSELLISTLFFDCEISIKMMKHEVSISGQGDKTGFKVFALPDCPVWNPSTTYATLSSVVPEHKAKDKSEYYWI